MMRKFVICFQTIAAFAFVFSAGCGGPSPAQPQSETPDPLRPLPAALSSDPQVCCAAAAVQCDKVAFKTKGFVCPAGEMKALHPSAPVRKSVLIQTSK